MTAKEHQSFILAVWVGWYFSEVLPIFTEKQRAQVISHKVARQKRTPGEVGKYKEIDISELVIRD